ncbi:hypothetical protein GCM10011607_28980 [Shewanella inventionis]|uniref:Uncharacterized protein n=1 Tax=Shewanella inventionis TaxID=1738770 RepID=A0ABQ1JI31_9GAMM|nr:hypothetical protein [Shewanella inventionis]GGB66555.1 hypothetical protein GCM10011607_28980 [Shewanella inventionis]
MNNTSANPITLNECLSVASQCATKSEFRKHSTHYRAAQINGWLEQCNDIITFTSKDECIRRAQNCLSPAKFKQWQKKYYKAAMENDWLDDCWQAIKTSRRDFTLDECVNQSKACINYSDFKTNYSVYYQVAERNGWLSQCLNALPKHSETYDACISAAQLCKTEREFRATQSHFYLAAKANKWLADCYSSIRRPYTLEECIAQANLCETKSEFKRITRIYRVAKKNGWLDECFSHIAAPSVEPTLDLCLLKARKYSNKRTFKMYQKELYKAAEQNGWLDLCVYGTNLTLEDCVMVASQCTSRKEFATLHEQYYQAAKNNGWLVRCLSALKPGQIIKPNKPKAVVLDPTKEITLKLCIADAKRFSTKEEWQRESFKIHNRARSNGWHKHCCKHMKKS